MSEVERIARGLSPAQKKALLWLPEDGAFRSVTQRRQEVSFYVMKTILHGDPRLAVATMACLCDAKYPPPIMGRMQPPEWRATPLGLAVRAAVARAGGGE